MESPTTYLSLTDYPTPVEENLWLQYRPEGTNFRIWSPAAEQVQLHLYEDGNGGEPIASHQLEREENGIWEIYLTGDLAGTYYTFQVQLDGDWLDETPGIYAQAVGVNGERAMVIDLDRTNPEGWQQDQGPEVNSPNEAIIYELHIRDMTIHPESGSAHPGKYLGLAESGTTGPEGVTTGIDHLKELGITHVHLLPTYDHQSIDETRLDSAQFNWGYDPQNYNVPEGSFASDPYRAEVRIREFKQMVKALHDAGIGVILDVVYNHTGRTEDSNFNLEAPGYYYRYTEEGDYSNASGCGNETASDRAMMRKFIVESVAYWAEEYHLDGFRFDLMAIHDIATMNEVTRRLQEINPNIIVYGEGWTAGDSPLPVEQRALKAHTQQMPGLSAFSDDLRDGLKGSVFEEKSTGFVSGAEGTEASILFGIVGSIAHPQIDFAAVNYSDTPWTNDPWQAVSYVSCHDNHTLYDKLLISRPDANEGTLAQMSKLANAIVLTSQGMAFLHAGAEMLRTKQGEHNSYNLPDSINRIDWHRKVSHADVVAYYRHLIEMRKAHPAFRMPTAELVREHLSFEQVESGLISYRITDHANGDSWREILVIYNARPQPVAISLEGTWQVGVLGDVFNGGEAVEESLEVPPVSMAVLYRT